jgi:large subunit ribosomal protein L6
MNYMPFVTVTFDSEKKQILVSVNNPESSKEKPFWGLYRATIANFVKGVTDGFEKKLELSGVGFSVTAAGNKLKFNLGYSHPVEYVFPEGITGTADKGGIITISGADKQSVGQVAAEIRKLRKVDPYKLKGIKYIDEVIIKKAGKLAKSVGK